MLNQIDRFGEFVQLYVASGTISAAANVFAALGTLYIMQAITENAGIADWPSFLHLLHRISHACLSLAFVVNAVVTVTHDSTPRPVDVLVHIVFAVVTAIAVLRLVVMTRRRDHALSTDPPIPPQA